VAVDLDYMDRSMKGQMKQAGRSGARYAFIVGEQELADGTVTVRDLAEGTERRMGVGEAVGLPTPSEAS
jgi:histidyl-tRNA synthetase